MCSCKTWPRTRQLLHAGKQTSRVLAESLALHSRVQCTKKSQTASTRAFTECGGCVATIDFRGSLLQHDVQSIKSLTAIDILHSVQLTRHSFHKEASIPRSPSTNIQTSNNKSGNIEAEVPVSRWLRLLLPNPPCAPPGPALVDWPQFPAVMLNSSLRPWLLHRVSRSVHSR